MSEQLDKWWMEGHVSSIIYINITGQCSERVAPLVSHPPIPSTIISPSLHHWHDSLTSLFHTTARQQVSHQARLLTNRRMTALPGRGPSPSLHVSSDTTIQMSRGDGETHAQLVPHQPTPPSSSTTDGCGRIRDRIAQLSQDRPPPPLRSPVKSGDQMLYISLSLQPPWNCYTHPC